MPICIRDASIASLSLYLLISIFIVILFVQPDPVGSQNPTFVGQVPLAGLDGPGNTAADTGGARLSGRGRGNFEYAEEGQIVRERGSLPAALGTSQGTTSSSDADDSTAVRERVEAARKRRRRELKGESAADRARIAAMQTERIFSAALPEPLRRVENKQSRANFAKAHREMRQNVDKKFADPTSTSPWFAGYVEDKPEQRNRLIYKASTSIDFLRNRIERRRNGTERLHATSERQQHWSLYASAPCPGFCSGHGFCKAQSCVCHRGWHGVDCSIRRCPYGPHHPFMRGMRVHSCKFYVNILSNECSFSANCCSDFVLFCIVSFCFVLNTLASD